MQSCCQVLLINDEGIQLFTAKIYKCFDYQSTKKALITILKKLHFAPCYKLHFLRYTVLQDNLHFGE